MPNSATSAAATSSCVATGFQCTGEVARLARHVEAGRETEALERLLLLEALADAGEDGHRAVRPLHAQAALRGEREVLDVVGRERGGRHQISFWPCADSRTASTMYVARATSPDSEGTR